ncbi:MAG: tol-pal system protein YbgF [Polyangiaceae bacterium]
MRKRALWAVRMLALVASVAFGANFGCGRSAEERQLDSMRDEIDNVREGRDRADHAAGARDPAGPSIVVPPAYTSTAQVRPPPPVLELGTVAGGATDDSAETADPQDTTPRPTIRVFGAVRSVRGARRGDDQIEMAASDEAVSDGTSAASGRGRDSSVRDPEAKRAYDAALSLVNTKRFEQALDAFAAFLVKWPDHPYAENAMYWRGECYFARGDYVHASEQFDGALKRFPSGNKSADALLKLGMSAEKLGKSIKARECFDRLARQYPDSDAAHHIPAPSASAGPSDPAREEGR